MTSFRWLMVVISAGVLGSSLSKATSFAEAVIQFSSGSTPAPGYDNPQNSLAEPSRLTPAGPNQAPVDPFNPPWPNSQLLSIGAGGSLTVRFGTSIIDASANPFGVDFIVFGNNGFSVVDYNVPPENWTTDGSLFTLDPPGATRVWVSENNVDYFELVPPADASATVDGLFPSDAAGVSTQPVNPRLKSNDFAGKTLEEIRGLYAGSGGGTGFDLAWARTELGAPANLTRADYVRIEVLSGKVEVDAFAVVPEPSIVGLVAFGGILLSLRFRKKLKSGL